MLLTKVFKPGPGRPVGPVRPGFGDWSGSVPWFEPFQQWAVGRAGIRAVGPAGSSKGRAISLFESSG
ncbi:hypothetical protein Hanom_Chr16g01509351 [Helianthus anomalus]